LSCNAINIIDLTGEVSLPSSSTTDPYEPPQPRTGGAISFQVCHKKWGRKWKVDECTPNSLALSQTPSAMETLANVNSSPLLRSSLAEFPAIPSYHSPPGHSEPSKGTTLNEDNDDYSSDGWLDIDTIFPDAGLELSPLSSRSNSRGDGGKEATRQSNRKFYLKDDAQLPPCIARNSDPSKSQHPESLAITQPLVFNQQRILSLTSWLLIRRLWHD
jgi:hypothetical protein